MTREEKEAFEAVYKFLSNEALWLSPSNMRDWYRRIVG